MNSMDSIKIKVFGSHADVFFGNDGWEPWARFKLRKTGKGVFLEHECGNKVPGPVFRHVCAVMNGD